MIKNRNVALCIIYSIITCGIYGIYWFICLTNEMNEMSPDDYVTSGGLAFLWSLLTCNIYLIFWNYKMGIKMNAVEQQENGTDNSNHILFLVLSLLGLGIVNYCIMQSKLNSYATI